MQSVFSRAAQAHFCNCRPCAQAAKVMIRRSATATAGRKATASDIFTACYTTILGAAAVADAHYKDRRREELDRRLDEARNNLGHLTKETTLVHDIAGVYHPAGNHSLTVPRYSLRLVPALESICDREVSLAKFHDQKKSRRQALQDIHEIYAPGSRLQNSLSAMHGVNYETVDEALMMEEEHPDFQHREPQTQNQFSRFTAMVNQLVDALVMETHRLEHPDDPEAMQRSLESLDSSWTAMRLLRSDDYPRYNHPGLDSDVTQDTRQELNRALRAIFSDWDKGRHIYGWDEKQRKFLVAKICYNILVSPIPPSIHHFNALILGFTRVSEHSLSQIVVDSLLQDSKLRTTPQTAVCLLHHYRAKEDIVGFYSVIRRLMAIDSRGLLIRRKRREDLQRYRSLRAWARSSEVTGRHHQSLLVERLERSDDVYDAMIKGLLAFDRIKDAAKVFVACMIENCSISTKTLVQLVLSCLWYLDKAAASVLVRGFLDHPDAVSSILTSHDCPMKLPREIYNLFHLARMPPDRPSAQLVRVESRPRLQDNFTRLSTILFAKAAEKYLTLLGGVLRRAKRALVSSNLPLEVRAMMALNNLQGVQRSIRKGHVEASRYSRMVTIHAIQKQCTHIIPNNIQSFEFVLVKILIDALPKWSIKRKLLKMGAIPLTTRVGWYLARRPDIDAGMLALMVDDCLTIGAKWMLSAKWTLLKTLPEEQRNLLYEIHQSFERIPLETVLQTNLQAVDNLTEDVDNTNHTPPVVPTEAFDGFSSIRAPSHGLIGWQMKYT